MACTNCSTDKSSNGVPRGCQSRGTCGTDSCNKLAVFDWLANMVYPSGAAVFDIVEVRFKNGRKDFYRYPKELTISMGDVVATEASPGHDVGIVSLTGELVKVQMKKKHVNQNGEILKIYRKATQKDIDIWQQAQSKEEPVRMKARELAISLSLEMKISDVEFQGDGSKATFYYTASERVDFRQLIKDFAREFSIRIEMKQVGFRQEAARLGGVGSCGRELCCSTWLTDFRSVNTAAARYQQLSLNPQKLAGQCGKLKCCLNYELDTYLEAIKDMPDSDTRLLTVKGLAVCQKINIFKGQMWFAYANNSANWYVLTTEQVKEILALNAQDQRGQELESYSLELEEDVKVRVMEEDSVTRFDQPKRKKKPARKRVKEEVSSQTNDQASPVNKTRVNRNNKKPRVKGPKATGESVGVETNRVDVTSDKVSKDNRTNKRATEGKEAVKHSRGPKAPRVNKDPKQKLENKEAKDNSVNKNTQEKVLTSKPKNNRNKNRKPKNTNNQNDTPSPNKE